MIELKARSSLFLTAIRAGDLVTDLLIGTYVATWLEGLRWNALGYWSAISSFAGALARSLHFSRRPTHRGCNVLGAQHLRLVIHARCSSGG